MAKPITHIVLSEKIRDKLFPDKVAKDFFIGTSFPDIRHLKVIDKEATHHKGLSVADLALESSFQAGLKFHSILDLARERFMVENGIYDLAPKSDYIVWSVKLLEDKIFYQYISDWSQYIIYFDDILEEQKNYNIPEIALRKWHNMLQEYLENIPNEKSITKHILSIGHPQAVADEINYNISILEKDERVLTLIDKLYQEFESLIGSI